MEIKLLSDKATIPQRHHDTDAGFDIFAAESMELEPQEKAKVSTDIAVNIPNGYVGLLTSRSGVSSKTHLVIETGKIDAGYQGNVQIIIKNDIDPNNVHAFELADIKGGFILDNREKDGYSIGGNYHINKGDKLAQLVLVPICTPELQQVNEFSSKSARGTNGFGSSGIKEVDL